jgi:hypothetical protein
VSANRLAVSATNHCLTGCGIGEVLGMVLATWWGWGDAASIALAILLAFFFGYLLTLIPLLGAGTALAAAVGIALVADTLSIATMEIVDNAVLLIWPGALDAGLGDFLFWASLAIALAVAWGPDVPREPRADQAGEGPCAGSRHARPRALTGVRPEGSDPVDPAVA